MKREYDFEEIGRELRQYATEDADFTKRQGVIDELFPYVYQASRRMSTRAISRWLWETKRVKLSAVTIAKALREADRYWAGFFETIEPDASAFARAHGVSPEDFLEDENAFEVLCGKPPTLAGTEALEGYQDAEATLRTAWFGVLDERARAECMAGVAVTERAEQAKGKAKRKEQGHERGERKHKRD